MTIGGYFIGGYWWLLIDIILLTIGVYYINGYWWLFRYKPIIFHRLLFSILSYFYLKSLYFVLNYFKLLYLG
jgi:hypothetical protein